MSRKVDKKKLPGIVEDPNKYPPSDVPITIVARDRWSGLYPKLPNVEAMTNAHKQVCFVPTESQPCATTEECIMQVRELQKRNMLFKNWPDIPFNFLIGGDGLVYEGRGFLMRYKDFGIPDLQTTLQIGYIGYFKENDPPKEMVDLGAQLIKYGIQRNFIDKDFTYIECPLNEYYQYPKSFKHFFERPEYEEFLSTVPPPPPPIAQRN